MQIAICLMALLATFQATDAAAGPPPFPDSGYYNCLFSPCKNSQVCDPAHTSQCKDVITGDTSGTCVATGTPYYNYNCGSDQMAITGTECDAVPCVGANTHDCGAGNGGPCVCKAPYYNIDSGDQTCATARAHAICKNTGMDIIFAPHEGADFIVYGGKVVQVNQPTDDLLIPTCAFTPDPTNQQGGAARYSILNFPYLTPAPGDCVLPVLTAGTPGAAPPDPDKYTTTWYIQYGSTLGASNVKFTVECQKPTDPLVEVAAQISVVLEAPTDTVAALQETVTAAVEWRIAQLSDLGVALTGAIPKDVIHALVIDMAVSTSPASLYPDHILLRLTGYNWDISELAVGAGTDDPSNDLYFSHEEFIMDACALKAAGGVLRGMRKVNVAASAPDPAYVRTIVDFIGFNFPTQAPGYDAGQAPPVPVGTTWLQVLLCLGCTRPLPADGTTNTPLLAGVDCGGTGGEMYISTDDVFTDLTAAPTGRRRRRQVEGSIPQEMIASNMSVVFVGFDNSGPARTIIATPGQDSTSDCHQTMSFLIPIILLSALLLVAVAMAAFFCLKVSRSQGHPEGHTNMAYK